MAGQKKIRTLNRSAVCGICIVAFALMILSSFPLANALETGYELSVEDVVEMSGRWPEGLKERFKTYWSARLARKPEETMQMEAPYFRETANQVRYRGFINRTRQGVHSIEVKGVSYRNQNLVWVECSLPVKDEERRQLWIRDEWVESGGQWFHVFKDSVLFPELE